MEEAPTRERGRPARMHCRCVPLSFPAIWHLAALPAEAPWIRAKQSPRRKLPPGARASRPHALPSRAAQFPRDGAPGHPAGRNGMGPAEAESWRRCRSTQVVQMAEAVPGRVRAGRPRSRVGCPNPVALLPPRCSGRALPFSMPIDTYGRRWSLKQVHRSSCPWEFIRGSSSFQYDDHQLLRLSKGRPAGVGGVGPTCNFPGSNPKFPLEWEPGVHRPLRAQSAAVSRQPSQPGRAPSETS